MTQSTPQGPEGQWLAQEASRPATHGSGGLVPSKPPSGSALSRVSSHWIFRPLCSWTPATKTPKGQAGPPAASRKGAPS